MQLTALLPLMIRPLTSLRFLFAFMVFCSHCGFYKNPHSLGYRLYYSIMQEGFIGVGFFFMLSGFVLALNYSETLRVNAITKSQFWLTRLARIYPLYLLSLLITLPFTIPDYRLDPGLWQKQLVLCLPMLQSYLPKERWAFALNKPSWSISNEAFFYAMFPFLITSLRPRKRLWLLPCILLLSLALAMAFTPRVWQEPIFYFNPLVRLADFIVGILLFQLYNREPVQWTYKLATRIEIVALIVFGVFFALHRYIPEVYRYSVYYWVPIAFIIYVFARSSGALSQLLSARVLVILGELSFAFYLIHYSVGWGMYLVRGRLHLEQDDCLYILLYFLTTLAASVVLHFCFDRPMYSYLRKRVLGGPRNNG